MIKLSIESFFCPTSSLIKSLLTPIFYVAKMQKEPVCDPNRKCVAELDGCRIKASFTQAAL